MDLRERIVEAVLERRFSIREAADTFRVGHATVERYLRQFRERGGLTPCKPPGRPSRVEGEQLEALRKQLELFRTLTAYGETLTALHLMERVSSPLSSYPVDGDNIVDKPVFVPDDAGTAGRV